jgi:dihydroneopterin aldolase
VLTETAKTQPLVVVPGGGPLADAVRDVTERHDPGESASHWMAILAMDQVALLLAGLAPTARLAREPRETATVCGQGRLAILAPFTWLRAEDPLPHGWHVTSDSLAAWIAGALGAERLVLLKSTGVATADVVDPYFSRALPPRLECWLLGGRDPEGVRQFLSGGRARGTRLR